MQQEQIKHVPLPPPLSADRDNSLWRLYKALVCHSVSVDDKTAGLLLAAALLLRHDAQLDPIEWNNATYNPIDAMRAVEEAHELLRKTGGGSLIAPHRCACGFAVYGPEHLAEESLEQHMLLCNHPDLWPRPAIPAQAQPLPAAEPPAKRKRGRPRKAT